MEEKKSLLSRIITWVLLGMVALLVLKLAAWMLRLVVGVVGTVFGIAMFLLFTVGPIVLLGWLAVKGWKAFTKEPTT